MIYPPLLQKGDTVGIISTARAIHLDEISFAINFLKTLGLRVKIGKTIGPSYHQFAGTDEQRVLDFQEMVNDVSIKAIWCARGGYGTVRVVDSIDFSPLLTNPKWIMGYSDITVLHSHLHNMGLQTLHAPMPVDVKNATAEALKVLKNSLINGKQPITYNTSNKLNQLGIAKGILIGGNLSVLYSLLGSTSTLITKGKILFLEDLDEYLYHMDRMMMNLKRNGFFNDLHGLIIGGMTKMNDNTIPFGHTAQEIIKEVVSPYKFPVCFDFPAGHILDNRALCLGSEVQLTVTTQQVQLDYL